jgi:hypothetical protein
MNLIAAFGEAADSPRLETLFKELNTLRRPELPEDDLYVYYDWILIRRQGVELGFVEENHHLGKARSLWGSGRLLFVQAYYYAGFDDVAACTFALPHGITWNDKREQVRERMAEASATLHSAPLSDTWDLPEGYRMTVTYAGTPLRAERMVCRLEPVPLIPPENISSPRLDRVIAHWGGSVAQPEWRALWQDWLDDDAIELGATAGEIDLADSFGVTLHVNTDGGKPLLRAITLHRNRDANTVGWTGQLPLGLDFEDSPDILFQKIRQKPVSASQGSTTGHAVWNFPDYTLHVLYSCVDNRLLRIKLLAPGVWKSIHDG